MQPESVPESCGGALRKGAERLAGGPHPGRARLDAETLLLRVLGQGKAWLLAHADAPLARDPARHYAELLERRLGGEPIQYILGETEFYGLLFRVTPDVLIPRPETEHLVEKAIALAGRFHAPRIVDIGTGSGAIAVALARHLPRASITATDISPAALRMARENAARNGVEERIRFLAGDLLAPVAAVVPAQAGRFEPLERFELVVSNPPYIPAADRATLAIEVRDYEPALAL
ncbi:MAG: peptide chain release factor N(5)-glutamine methyltransferase, partial [Terracidiphilus sp.]